MCFNSFFSSGRTLELEFSTHLLCTKLGERSCGQCLHSRSGHTLFRTTALFSVTLGGQENVGPLEFSETGGLPGGLAPSVQQGRRSEAQSGRPPFQTPWRLTACPRLSGTSHLEAKPSGNSWKVGHWMCSLPLSGEKLGAGS